MPYFLRLQESLDQFHGAVSKSMARTSRYVFHKIRSGVDGVLSTHQDEEDTPPPRATTPLKFPRLNETYLLMDVDYLRPQGARPWAPPHSLQVMNPDPDYLDEEYIQVGPSPTEVDNFTVPCAGNLNLALNEKDDQEPSLLSQMTGDGDGDPQADGQQGNPHPNPNPDPEPQPTRLSTMHPGHSPNPNQSLPEPHAPAKNDGIILCDDIEGGGHVSAALLAGVIRAGMVTQRCRTGLYH